MNRSRLLILFIVIIITNNIWQYNLKNKIDENAPIGKYSNINSYANISPLKHDIYKEIVLDILPFLFVNSIKSEEFFSIENFDNSIFGQTLLIVLTYIIYYQIIQPYIINKLPNF